MVQRVLGAALFAAFLGLQFWGFLFGGWNSGRIWFDPPISGGSDRFAIFPRTFFAPAGSRVEIEYDAEVLRGRLLIYVQKCQQGLGGPIYGRVDTPVSGSGRQQFTVPLTGLHRIVVDGSSRGGGYDVKYDVVWRVLR